MKNIKVTVDGETMTITVDLTKEHGVSASGKSVIVATTEGNQAVDNHPGMYVGVNVYKK